MAEDVIQKSLTLQDQTVSMRVDQNKNITSAMAESKVTLKTLKEQNTKKQALRDKLQSMHAKLRRMNMDIETKVVEN